MILIFFCFLTDFHRRIIISENCQVIRYTFLGKAAKFGHRAFFCSSSDSLSRCCTSHATRRLEQEVGDNRTGGVW